MTSEEFIKKFSKKIKCHPIVSEKLFTNPQLKALQRKSQSCLFVVNVYLADFAIAAEHAGKP